MPRIKSNFESIKNVTADEALFNQIIDSDPKLKNNFNLIRKVFKENFHFDEEEVKLFVHNICNEFQADTIERIGKLFASFSLNDIPSVDAKSRRKLARGLIDDVISIYKQGNKNIEETFIDVLNEAHKHHIDPVKLAIKTNLKLATEESFISAVYALAQAKYYDSNLNTESTLLLEEELKPIIEQCASLVNKADEANIKAIYNMLNELFYDTKKGEYTYEVKELIKSAPSILTTSASNMEYAIEWLKLICVDNKTGEIDRYRLLSHIKNSPTILTVDFKKIEAVDSNLKEIFKNLLNKTPEGQRMTPAEREKTAAHTSYNYVFNIFRLTSMTKINADNLVTKTRTLKDGTKIVREGLADVLEKYLGAKNAMTCLQNSTVLNTDPQLLDYVLASLVKAEKEQGVNLRERFVESPSRALGKSDEILGAEQSDSKTGLERGKRAKIDVSEMPEILLQNIALDTMKNRLNSKNKGMSNQFLDNIARMAEEERKKQAALKEQEREAKIEQEKQRQEWLAEQKRIEKERKAAEKAAAEERRKQEKAAAKIKAEEEAKRKAEEKAAATQQAEDAKKQAELDWNNLPEHEKQKIRFSKVQLLPINTDHDVDRCFDNFFSPIIKGLKSCKMLPPELNNYSSALKSFSKYFDTLMAFNDTHTKIAQLADQFYNVVFEAPKDKWEERLTSRASKGRILLDELTVKSKIILQEIEDNDKAFNSALRTFDRDYPKDYNGKRVSPIDYSQNLIKRDYAYKTNFKEYIDWIKDATKTAFGEEGYKKCFEEGERAQISKHFDELFNKFLNPKLFNGLEYNMYISHYMKVIIYDEFTSKGYIKNQNISHLQKLRKDIAKAPIPQAHKNFLKNTANAVAEHKWGIDFDDIDEFTSKVHIIDADASVEKGYGEHSIQNFCNQFSESSLLTKKLCDGSYIKMDGDTMLVIYDEENALEVFPENADAYFKNLPSILLDRPDEDD